MIYEKQGLYLPEFEHENCGAGFICSLNGERTHSIIHDALEILIKLEHRGAVSSDGKTGDGAGLLIDIPHKFFKKVCNFELPEPKEYAVGMVFLPQNENQSKYCIRILEKEILKQDLKILGWRNVPVNSEHLGEIAKRNEPVVKQIFVGKNDKKSDLRHFNARVYMARKIAEHKIISAKLEKGYQFYLPSFSTTTLIYKGLLIPEDIRNYYSDLSDKDLVTRLALVHQRFSTNTSPTWDLAQPFRFMCHNGEINTLRGNISRMGSREELLKSELLGTELEELFPVILEGKSDSASMDMVVELLLISGRTLPEIMMMLIPEAWERDDKMIDTKKAFYEYNSCVMEPWDGPASVPFTDGDYIGAVLDRNGLRPSRYTITKNGYVVMSSETGVLDIKPEDVVRYGRLEPGKMFLVDMNKGRILEDEEIKNGITSKYPYRKWLNENLLPLEDIQNTLKDKPRESTSLEKRMRLFGYTLEDINTLIKPMFQTGKEAIGSMGTDTPLAILSDKPQSLYNYFKQLFAQVTNPPLDGIREEIITDISLAIGEDRNLLEISPQHCKKIKIQNPIISNKDLLKIKNLEHPDFKSIVIPMLYDIRRGLNAMEKALDNIIIQSAKAVDNGYNIIILSDRGTSRSKGPIPALLATSYLHHSLHNTKKRSKFGIIVESAEPREPHHFAILFGYGASAINPYMVNEIIRNKVSEDENIHIDEHTAVLNYNKAIGKGILKIMNKVGISTLHSYRASQIFEALGLKSKFINKYFPHTPSRIEGIGLYEVEREISRLHKLAFFKDDIPGNLKIDIGGNYRWRRTGERHMFNPATVAKLQQAVRSNDTKSYHAYAKMINEQNKNLMTLRGLFEFKNLNPVPIEEVEPWTEIVKRFKTGAMSYGSISKEAHENLAIAMNRIGGKSNSGEGGEDKSRFRRDLNGDSRNSAIKQVASGRFGVTSNYLTNAMEIQIKMAQGAKPGEGGQLPGEKVFPWIAEVRNSTPHVGLISPPPHHDIYSIEDLSQLIFDLKSANRKARINVKLVSEVGVGTIASGVAKAKADVILISGYDGGTGASPLTSLKHAGLPWELGLAEAQQTLVLNNLRSRIVLECDGQLKTGRDVAIACLLGAEEFGFATAPLVASGCIMMRKCHLNTCPVGIATQDPELRKNFKGTPEHVINFMYFIAEELRSIMAKLGFRTVTEMIGQSQKIDINKALDQYKTEGIDLSAILYQTENYKKVPVSNTEKQNHELSNVLDLKIVLDAHPAIYRKERMDLSYSISNTDRTVGAILSNEISKIYGSDGLPENTLRISFTGSAGQSFGAFATKGISLKLTGNSNDYLGKGLSGATIVVKKPEKADFKAEENIIIGNVCFYGAVSGKAFINGIAGERFCVRNSGIKAVVEGVGDHGCEYMTGGKVIVLGKTGRNFAAGMSGGTAYVYDPDNSFKNGKCNMEMVEFEEINKDEKDKLFELIQEHYHHTESERAIELLNNWDKAVKYFVKIMPVEYKKALERAEAERQSLSLK